MTTTRTLFSALTLLAALVSPAYADLRVTVRAEVTFVSTPPPPFEAAQVGDTAVLTAVLREPPFSSGAGFSYHNIDAALGGMQIGDSVATYSTSTNNGLAGYVDASAGGPGDQLTLYLEYSDQVAANITGGFTLYDITGTMFGGTSLRDNLGLVNIPAPTGGSTSVTLTYPGGSLAAEATSVFIEDALTVGSTYCLSNPNSTGLTATTSAVGSFFIADNNLTIRCDQLPLSTTVLFLTSSVPGLTPNPPGSAGNVCLGGNIGRFIAPGQVKNSGSSGTASLVTDLLIQPTSLGFVSVQVGETWFYQSWFRDSDAQGSLTSNFSHGVAVLFQ